MHHFERLPISLDIANLSPDVNRGMVVQRRSLAEAVDKNLRAKTCPGADFTGWLKPGEILEATEVGRITETAAKLREISDVLLVIGIGGSYLGARAVIEALAEDPDIVVYAGQNISAHYMKQLRDKLAGKRVAINVISKSGTTTEPALAFRVMRDLIKCVEPRDCIVATTDANKGALLELAEREGYQRFVVPDDIGGRYSVLSAVGLLPIAYAGVDIDRLIEGAVACSELCANPDPEKNPALFYAIARGILYSQGYCVEMLANFEPRLHYISEWWKQLYGESEGKENMSLFPASVDFTTDLHSMGQYIQQGRRMLAETFVIVEGGEPQVNIPKFDDNSDGLNYLAEGEFNEASKVNMVAYRATAQAHREGGVPNMTVLLQQLDAHSLGALIYFFEYACAISGLMLGVNPFDQPGVEAYKTIMFKMLGKPGFEGGANESTSEYVSF